MYGIYWHTSTIKQSTTCRQIYHRRILLGYAFYTTKACGPTTACRWWVFFAPVGGVLFWLDLGWLKSCLTNTVFPHHGRSQKCLWRVWNNTLVISHYLIWYDMISCHMISYHNHIISHHHTCKPNYFFLQLTNRKKTKKRAMCSFFMTSAFDFKEVSQLLADRKTNLQVTTSSHVRSEGRMMFQVPQTIKHLNSVFSCWKCLSVRHISEQYSWNILSDGPARWLPDVHFLRRVPIDG